MMSATTFGLNVASSLLAGLALVVSGLTFRRAAQVRRRARELEWIEEELGRALEQLGSRDAADVLAGLHKLTAIKDDGAAVLALPKLLELRGSPDSQVAKQASIAARRVGARLSG